MKQFIKKTFPGVKNAGFTLIELLVVVLIIGILSSVALPQYQVAVAKSRYMELMTLVRKVKDAQELYYMANGRYAKTFAELDMEMPPGGTFSAAAVTYPASGNTVVMYHFGKLVAGANGCNNYEVVLDQSGGYNGYAPGEAFCWATGQTCSRTIGTRVCRSFGGARSRSGYDM